MRKILLSLIAVLYINSFTYCQTNLIVSTINATDVVFSWDNGVCAQGNYILRYKESGAAWSQNSPITIGNTGGSQTHPLSGLTASTTYNWRIKCGNTGSFVDGPDFTTSSACIETVTQTITDFSPDPLTGYMQFSIDTLTITNTSTCNINIRPEFVISHATSAIQQGDFTIEWKSPLGGWDAIPYQINGSGDAYGFWSYPAGDSTGFDLGTNAPQSLPVRVAFMNPNNSPPNGAPFGTYTAVWITYQVDSLGNILQTLAPSSSVSLSLVDCSTFSIDSTSSSNVSCTGGADGSASVFSIANGSGTYSYLWSNGDTNASSTNLAAGTYSCIVTDNNWACTDSVGFIITGPSALTVSLTGTHVTCNGANDGTLTATASGGSGNYKYVWTPSLPFNPNQSSLGSGLYTLTLVDLGCPPASVTANFTINEPSVLTISSSSANNNSCDTTNCNGNISISLSGGTQPYSYIWTNGYTDSIRNDLCADTYSINATDANSCNTFTEIGTIVDNPLSIDACITGVDVSCTGGTDGSAQAIIGVCGGISTLTYCASSPGISAYSNIELVRLVGDGDSIVNNTTGICDTYEDYTSQYTSLTPGGTYSVDVNLGTCTSGQNQIDSAGIFIDWNIDGDFTDPGEKVGVFGGVQSPTSNTISFVVPNGYYGATRMRIVSQAQISNQTFPDGPVAACAVGDFGASYNQPWYGATEDYSIVISGSIPATYLWSNGATTASISGVVAGVYSCTTTDLSGCSSTDSVAISEPSAITVTETVTNVSCNAGSDGTATLIITGGTGTLTPDWGTANPTQLSEGTYSYTITDANQCTYTNSVTITDPLAITVTETVTNVSCNAGSDGTATLIIAGGTGVLTEDWGTANPTQLSTGIYNYTITDANQCTYTDTVTITEPLAISASSTITDVSCNGGNNGSATVNISGGVTNYILSWGVYTYPLYSAISVFTTPTGVPAGTYPFSITDDNGCSFFDTIIINQPTAISVTETISDVSCNAGSDGAVILNSSGGTGVLTEDWGTVNPTQLSAGIYNYTITDANQCTYTNSVTITDPSPIAVTETITNVSCNAGSDGAVTLNSSGGTGVLTEDWGTVNPTQLSAGIYNYTITDANQCTYTNSVTITDPSPITVTETITNVSCNGGNDGTATLIITGGTGVLTEDWGVNNPSSLSVGVYYYTVADENGCIFSDSIAITEPSLLTFDAVNINNVTNCASPDGSIDITISGGTTPHTYAWSNGQTSEDITNLSAGNYSVTVTDDEGCTIDSSNILVGTPNQINWTINTSNYNGYAVSCNGASDGEIYISTSGGVGVITYSWPTIGSVNDTVNNLSAGTYTVIATDNSNCSDTRNIEIHEPNIIYAQGFITQLNCDGGGSLFSDSLIITGGVPSPSGSPYTTIWLNGDDPDSLSVGIHYYTITDINNCSITDSVTLFIASPLNIVGFQTDVSCYGGNSGAATFLVTGGAPPYTYLWNNGDTNAIAINLIEGIYSCIITDNNNCNIIDSVFVSQPSSPLSSSISVINTIACFGDSTGVALITVNGGWGSYSYSWNNGETNSLAVNLSVGINICTIIDYNNCELSDTINITQSPNIIYSDSISDYNNYQIRCHDDDNGLINITIAGGGVPSTQGNPYSYQWIGPNGFTDTTSFIDSLIAGEYSVILSDSLGCEKRDTFLLEEPDLLYTSLDSTYDLKCWGYANNPADGFAAITIYGGVTSYTLNSTLANWAMIGGDSVFNFTGHPAGTHTYMITDDNSCTYTDSFTLIHLTDSLFFTSTLSNYNGVNISCKGYSDGWITIDAILGGLAPHVFNWSNGDSALVIDTLSVGWYTSTLTDSFGCVFIDNIQITEPDFALDTYLDTFSVSCNGYCDGMLIANSIDGTVDVTGPYTFQWYDNINNLISTNDTVEVCAGAYSLIVTDNNGCINNLTTSVSEPLILSINLDSLFNVSANGLSDGAVYINASGGNGGNVYSWIGPNGYTSTNIDIDNLLPGTYQVVVSDILGCYSDTATYIITEPPSVSINIDSINCNFITTCYDSCDGSITINPILSPAAAFTTYWMGPNGYTSTDEDIDSLCAGNYILYIISGTDSIEFNFTINEPDSLQIGFYTDSILCYAGNALITAYTYGGTLPYNWLWSNGIQNISTLLDAGTHYVTVTDYNGCIISDSITLSQPDSIWFTANTVPPSCNNGTDGVIIIDTINIQNGTSPFLYSIDNFITYQTSDIFINLSPGGYLISIEDSNGCIAIDSFFISNPGPFSVTTLNSVSSADTVDCYGDCNGLVQFNYSNQNGTPNPSWEQWSGVNLNGELCPGMYNCLFTDDNGCTTSLNNITIYNAPPITVNSASSNAPTCKDGDDGWAQVFASGGTGAVSYIWPTLFYNGQPSPHNWTVNPVTLIGYAEAGNYWCKITDDNFCVDSINVIVPENTDTFLVEIIYTSPGVILETGLILGNTANPYDYEWSTGATSSSITPGPINGQYWLLLTDTNGCVSDTAFYNIRDLISSTEELASANILIYPNPTNGGLFIESENNISKIDVLNYLGELVLSKEIEKQSQLKNYTINLSKFSKGIYHLQITINNQISNHKIILQ